MTATIELAHPRAEESLLACLVNERLAASTAMGMMLRREDFAYEVNALLYDAIVRLIEQGSMVDKTVLVAELSSSGMLDVIGGEEVVDQIASSPYEIDILSQYVALVKDRAMRRRLMEGFRTCTSKLFTVSDGKELLDSVQTSIYRTLDEYTASSYSGIRGSDLASSWESRHERGPRMDYPWRTATAVLGGRNRGDLSIWGLYTSDGKSTIALRNVVMAGRAGLKVGFFLLEMTDEQITARLLAYLTGLPMDRLERDELSLEDRQLIEAAFVEIRKWDLMIYCDPAIDADDIRAIQMREKFDLIEVDYLQRMDFREFKDIPRIAKKLKNIALTTKCHIDLYSQITPKALDNRSQNPFPKPDVNMLYGGKATAHEADNVIFLWAHRAMDDDGGWNNRTGYGTLVFAKVRQGRPGLEVNMKWDANRIQWEEA